MSGPIRAVFWGVGALGRLAAEAAAADARLAIVGAIDHAPEKAGRDLADLTVGVEHGEIVVAPDLDTCLRELRQPADVLFHMTESSIPVIAPQLHAAVDRGLNVISAAESMFYPALRHPQVAVSLDEAARARGVTVTGTGVNPGFIFDTLVLATASASSQITSIRLNRVVEVAGTGPGDIDHTGFGLSLGDFQEKLEAGQIVGHMGFAESQVLVAERLGLPIDRLEEHWEPVTRDHPITSAIGILEPGHVTGIVQTAVAYRADRPVISARLAMYYDAAQYEPEVDEITIEGRHTIHLRIKPSCISILSAAILMVNTAPALVEAAPGLVNVVDLPVSASLRGYVRLRLDPTIPTSIGTLQFVGELAQA